MKKTISNEEIASFCLEMSMLLHAGSGAGDALSLLSDESDDEYKELLTEIADKVDKGSTLARALKDTGRFPAHVCGLIEVGERSGRTEEALSSLSRYYENRVRLSRRVRSALLYPFMMLFLMVLVIGVLLIKVLPVFDDVYASLGSRLTGVAGRLLSVGKYLNSAMPVLLVLILIILIFAAAVIFIDSFRNKVTLIWRIAFGDRGISRKMNNARLIQALSMGIASGLPFEESLSLAAELTEDIPSARERCLNCIANLESGDSLSLALNKNDILSASQCRLLDLARKSGNVDAVIDKIAADLTEESENAIESKLSRVEPALVIVCSVLVGLILLSVMLPLMHIMSTIG